MNVSVVAVSAVKYSLGEAVRACSHLMSHLNSLLLYFLLYEAVNGKVVDDLTFTWLVTSTKSFSKRSILWSAKCAGRMESHTSSLILLPSGLFLLSAPSLCCVCSRFSSISDFVPLSSSAIGRVRSLCSLSSLSDTLSPQSSSKQYCRKHNVSYEI